MIVLSAIILNEKRINLTTKEGIKEEKIESDFDLENNNKNISENESKLKYSSDKLKKTDINLSNETYASTNCSKETEILNDKNILNQELDDSQNITNTELNNNIDSNDENLELKHQLNLFWTFLKTEKIYKPVIFIFLFMITPSYGDPMFYFYTNVLKFNPITIGRLRLVYGIASILGIYLYNNYLKNTSFKKIILVTTILSSFFNMLSLALVERLNLKWGIPDYMFCLATDALTTALSEINFLPILVLACNICPKNIEGTLYAFLMSIVNLSSLFSSQIGSGLTYMLGITSTNFVNLKYLIIISNLSLFMPMAFLYMINDNDYIKPKESSDEISNDKNDYEEEKNLLNKRVKNFLKEKKNQNLKEFHVNIESEAKKERLSHNISNCKLIDNYKKNNHQIMKEDENVSVRSSH